MAGKKQKVEKGTGLGSKNWIAVGAGLLVFIAAAFLMTVGNLGGKESPSQSGGDLIIPKNEVTDIAKFYPLSIDGQKLEILAVKASDGTIRTAFNTCQVCNGSPKAYFKQQGSDLVCQNCGNRYKPDMIGLEKGGCNPVPIMKENKTDDGTNITIARSFIVQNKYLFTANWKTK